MRAGDGEFEPREAGEQPLERDGRLGAGERGPQAHVDVRAEGDVAVRMAVEVQPLGFLEGGGVAVGGGEAGEDELAASDRPAVEFGIRAGVARLAELSERDV